MSHSHGIPLCTHSFPFRTRYIDDPIVTCIFVMEMEVKEKRIKQKREKYTIHTEAQQSRVHKIDRVCVYIS